MVASLKHRTAKAERVEAPGVRAVVFHHGHFDHPVSAATPDRSVSLLLDGWIFDGDGRVDAARACLRAYLERGMAFVAGLNGQFNLFVADARTGTAWIACDRYGTRPLQYAVRSGVLAFAPEGKAVLAGTATPPRLNDRMLVNALSYGRIWIGDETFFEDVRMLPPGTILRWEAGRVSTEKYWDYVFARRAGSVHELAGAVVEEFRSAVRRQSSKNLRYGISLSGGLDSRSLLAALTETGHGSIPSFTWGVGETNDETQLARRTAEAAGVPWTFVPLTPKDFLAHAREGAGYAEGLDLVVQSYGREVYPRVAREVNVLVTGLAFDVTLGGSYLSQELVAAAPDPEASFERSLGRTRYFSEEQTLRLLRSPETKGHLEALRTVARTIWDGGNATHPADRSDRFFLLTRVWRHLFQRQVWQRLEVEDIVPTFDTALVNVVLGIPPELRQGHNVYQQFLLQLAPGLAAIPYQRTTLPATVPREFWGEGTRLEEQRERLYREIWRSTDGKTFIPYTRYYTNFDEWLRRDPDWIAATEDLLLGNGSRLCAGPVCREAVAALIEEHRAGRATHHQRIVQLMGLEHLLRAFF
jgi:asparagine synthase (glutamine-hydrolysing)